MKRITGATLLALLAHLSTAPAQEPSRDLVKPSASAWSLIVPGVPNGRKIARQRP